jgi:hypothetical protein
LLNLESFQLLYLYIHFFCTTFLLLSFRNSKGKGVRSCYLTGSYDSDHLFLNHLPLLFILDE